MRSLILASSSVIAMLAAFTPAAIRPEITTITAPVPKLTGDWHAGLDYVVLPAPYQVFARPVPIPVEVRFLYTSDLSREMQPRFVRWAQSHRDIQLTFKPSHKWSHGRVMARLFYALEESGHADLQMKLYEWIYRPEHYDSIYHRMVPQLDAEAMFRSTAAFVAQNSGDPRRFEAAYRSREMDERMESDGARERQDGVGIVINRRYGTSYARVLHVNRKMSSEELSERLFRLLDELLDAERLRLRLERE